MPSAPTGVLSNYGALSTASETRELVTRGEPHHVRSVVFSSPKLVVPDSANPQLDSSAELLARIRTGDSGALDQLLRRHLPALRRWAAGRLPRWARDHVETEDLVQDTIVRSLPRLTEFEYRREAALQAYFRQSVMNRIRDECRRAVRRPVIAELDSAVPDGDRSPLERAIGTEAVERYEAALLRLAPDRRQMVIARIELGHTFDEIAKMFNKPSADAARVAVSRALIELADQMRHDR